MIGYWENRAVLAVFSSQGKFIVCRIQKPLKFNNPLSQINPLSLWPRPDNQYRHDKTCHAN
ncbi:MAG: hypothetical protein HW386_257 [Gammaproteobacteria bacterium]|nr:hypothetical protein [Gammaproteobacteria bacterium]